MKTIFPKKFKITQGYSKSHGGLDIVGLAGTNIISPVNGIVKSSIWVSKEADPITWEWGNYVRVDDASGTRYFFCHMAFRAVSVGQRVSIGDRLGIMGSTGKSDGAHCHFEVRTGASASSRINPADFLGVPNRCGAYNVGSTSKWVETSEGWRYGNLKSKWKKIDGDWYYFNSKGIAVTGPQLIDGKLYWFSDKAFHGVIKECQLIETNQYGHLK